MNIISDLCKITNIFFDFDGVFTDNSVYINENGIESVRCSRADGLGIRILHNLGIKMMIISTEENLVVASRAAKLKIPLVQACMDKAAYLKKYLDEECINPEHAAYVGNDINDLEAMGLFKFKVCPSDSYPEIISCANIKLNTSGGNGAVREFCDLIVSSFQNMTIYNSKN